MRFSTPRFFPPPHGVLCMWWIFCWKSFPVNFCQEKSSLKNCRQNFTTFFTLKFAISKEICRLVLTLGAISRKELTLSTGQFATYMLVKMLIPPNNRAIVRAGRPQSADQRFVRARALQNWNLALRCTQLLNCSCLNQNQRWYKGKGETRILRHTVRA